MKQDDGWRRAMLAASEACSEAARAYTKASASLMFHVGTEGASASLAGAAQALRDMSTALARWRESRDEGGQGMEES